MNEKCDKCGRNVHTVQFLVGFLMKKPVWRNVCRECYEKYVGKGNNSRKVCIFRRESNQMTKEEMAKYLSENRDAFPEYTDEQIQYVLNQWSEI